MDATEHSFLCQDLSDISLNFTAPLLIESGFPIQRGKIEEVLQTPLHPAVKAYLQQCLDRPRPLKSLCRDSRPVYIESCACVVKDAVKCNFECSSVVHQTCRIHSVRVGDGEMIKKPKSTLDHSHGKKKTKSSTKKNLGIGAPVLCIFFVTPYPITHAYLKIWVRQK